MNHGPRRGLRKRAERGGDGDRRCTDQQAGGDSVGLERVVQQAGRGLGDQDLGALQNCVVAFGPQRLQGCAVEVEDDGVLGCDLAVDGGGAHELRCARVDDEVGELDDGLACGEGQSASVVHDLALNVGAIDGTGLVVGDLTTGDREDEGSVGESRGSDGARGQAEGGQRIGEAHVECHGGVDAVAEVVDLGYRLDHVFGLGHAVLGRDCRSCFCRWRFCVVTRAGSERYEGHCTNCGGGHDFTDGDHVVSTFRLLTS